GAVVPTPADVAQVKGPPSPVDDVESAAPAQPPVPEILEVPEAASETVGEVASEAPAQQMPVPHAADASSVDVAMLRRSWQSLLDHLSSNREMILAAILESATVASYDGATLELAFPPDRKVGPQKVDRKTTELKAALGDMFGIRPDIRCVVREMRDGAGPATIEIVEDDEVVDEAEALKRVQEMLGAQVATDAQRVE
ncbi:MAG: hypothetical protein H0X05_07615, partial [Actinobacteria bacterium]|nr:hypothetical protein [Actinomycetota bacterium]